MLFMAFLFAGFANNLFMKGEQVLPQLEIWRACNSASQITDRGLCASELLGHIDLGNAGARNIGKKDLPVHDHHYYRPTDNSQAEYRLRISVDSQPMESTGRTAFGERLVRARKAAAYTQAAAAKSVKMSQGTLAQLEKEGTGSSYTAQLASLYNVNPQWLATGKGDMNSPSGSDEQNRPANAINISTSKFRQVPVIGKGMGGVPDRIWTDEGFAVGNSHHYAEIATHDQNAFIVRVEDVSMAPRFNPGEYALVEPNTAPEIEDDVLVRLIDGRTMIKRLLSRRGGIRLGSYNTVEVITAEDSEVVWMYYIAHPIPARKIKQRL